MQFNYLTSILGLVGYVKNKYSGRLRLLLTVSVPVAIVPAPVMSVMAVVVVLHLVMAVVVVLHLVMAASLL